MSGWGRGGIVAGVLATLIALPLSIARLPVADRGVPVDTLLARVRASEGVAYSGFAESLGTFAVPTTPGLSDLTELFGGHTRMRVWWRAPTDWRVDSVTPVGERSVYRHGDGAWLWDFAANRATRTTTPDVTLPAAPDLLPAELGRRLLSEASTAELQRLPARRIAGRATAGLRLRPSEPDATIDRVDAWVDSDTGLPLRVQVWAKGARQPAVQSAFLDLRIGTPSPRTTRFQVPARAQVRSDSQRDVGQLSARFGFGNLPAQLGGLPLRRDAPNLGSFGRGPTFLAAVPLVGRNGFRLADRIGEAPDVAVDPTDGSSSLTAGPLSLLVARVAGQDWLFSGTVTVAALRRAAAALQSVALSRWGS